MGGNSVVFVIATAEEVQRGKTPGACTSAGTKTRSVQSFRESVCGLFTLGRSSGGLGVQGNCPVLCKWFIAFVYFLGLDHVELF